MKYLKPVMNILLHKKLGEIMVENNFVTREQFSEALEIQKHTDDKIGEILCKNGYIDREQLQYALESQKSSIPKIADDQNAMKYLESKGISKKNIIKAFEKYYGTSYVNLDNIKIDPRLLKLLDFKTMRKEGVLPYYFDNANKTLYFAISDLGVQHLQENISQLCQQQDYKARFSFALAHEINEKYIEIDDMSSNPQFKEAGAAADNHDTTYIADENESDVVNWVNHILTKGVRFQASDVHIEPQEMGIQVRYRVDGTLSVKEHYDFLPDYAQSIASRIKIIAGMNIAEKRKPQSGRIDGITHNSERYDFRASSVSTVFGEKIVLRIFAKDAEILSFNELGFSLKEEEQLSKFLKQPYGIIYLSGATGSGKTTTLYTMIKQVDSHDINISTIENPVERVIPNINQVQIDSTAGVTYATTLRAFLHQDPDVIVVGEIRDQDTAELSVRASLTGHLVLSTIHANNAIDTISRLYNMNIELYLLGASAISFVSQRLVRKLCLHCREEQKPSAQEKVWIEHIQKKYRDAPAGNFYGPRGCPECNNTGYKGRVIVAEIVQATEEIREMITNKESIRNIRAKAIEQGFEPLEIKGYYKAAEGTTSIEEAIKTVTFF